MKNLNSECFAATSTPIRPKVTQENFNGYFRRYLGHLCLDLSISSLSSLPSRESSTEDAMPLSPVRTPSNSTTESPSVSPMSYLSTQRIDLEKNYVDNKENNWSNDPAYIEDFNRGYRGYANRKARKCIGEHMQRPDIRIITNNQHVPRKPSMMSASGVSWSSPERTGSISTMNSTHKELSKVVCTSYSCRSRVKQIINYQLR
ncbi:hypothetical protein LOTGIDRAFT_171282 [Lottia gigantea]|uniref:Uncharacterized protein n=1 Tax=Lottia gigantea TaxID=225164 RepID=V4B7P5_LOTGI|nr:hypothetical protein LOTGIDRAFT_171282 [Lottia gigantea]ESP03631.1 hypothetical protein LOTGIDRAFT_171282 [Lottia gigantea]